MLRPDPMVIDKVFHPNDVNALKELVKNYKSFNYSPDFGRYVIEDKKLPMLSELSKKLVPMGRYLFNSQTIKPTYALFSHYEGKQANLYKHKDNNACTYTIDYCLYQDEPWDLWVEGAPYKLQENQALVYYGNDQLHWREEFPNPETNKVAMIFFHFAEPDHWWFTKGPSYIRVISGNLTEEEWANSN